MEANWELTLSSYGPQMDDRARPVYGVELAMQQRLPLDPDHAPLYPFLSPSELPGQPSHQPPPLSPQSNPVPPAGSQKPA